jgi:chromosome segregation protein
VRLIETEGSYQGLALELEEMQSELAVLEDTFETERSAHTTLEEAVSLKKLEVQARRSRQLEYVQDISRLRNNLDRLQIRMKQIDASVTRLGMEDADSAAQLASLKATLEQEDVRQSEIFDAAIQAEREFHAMEERKQGIRSEVDQLQNRAFELQSQIGEKMTKIDFLNGLVDRLEGYSESVQHLLRNRDWAASKLGTIADAVNTRDELRIAVEAVLGDSAHYILVKDVMEAISGLHNLKQSKKGKATFACLSRIPKGTQSIPFPIAGDGVIGWAVELVSFSDQMEDLFHFLLKNVLIVRDAEIGQRCVREYPHLRCVTLDGDIFDSDGIIRGGSHGQEEGGLIGKKDQIAFLLSEVAQLKVLLENNQQVLEENNAEYNSIDLRYFAERLKQTQQDLSAHERHVAQMVFEIEKLQRLLQKNEEDVVHLKAEYEQISEQQNTLLPEIEALLNSQADFESEMEREASSLKELENEFTRSTELVNAKNVTRVQKAAAIQNTRNARERLEKTEAETKISLEQTDRELMHARESIDDLHGERNQLEDNLDRISGDRTIAEDRVKSVEAELQAKRAEANRVENTLHEERHKHTQIMTLVHETELKVSEIKHRLATLEQRALEEYELKLVQGDYGEEDVFDLGQAKEEINDLRMKIKALGLVNPLAFEEWKREQERQDLLTTQRQDLVDSRQTLHDTITEINRTAQEKFTETFAQIRENFISIFKSLFDEGDEADLTIGEHDDPLEARIDIVAKPRGKRPHSIDMLSGGEKTLTAIALLFAIYLVKPSPFCILDEVDAPLDDANIDRFIRIIRRFSGNTQFIVVTHNKRTMAAADTLYGVTMEEEGVSKIVAVNFATDSVARFISN